MTQDLATTPWQQLELSFTWPEQAVYELIRPVVLFGQSAAERSLQTGRPARTIRQKVQRFNEEGFRSFSSKSKTKEVASPWLWVNRGKLPDYVRQYIIGLNAEYSKLSLGEIGRICLIRFGNKPDNKTIKNILTSTGVATYASRRYPLYAQMSPLEGRKAILALFDEGWNVKSIATYLKISRQTVYTTIQKRNQSSTQTTQNLEAMLQDKSHARKDGLRKVDFKTMEAVRRLSRNPLLGRHRVSFALARQGIELSAATCGILLRRLRQSSPTRQTLQAESELALPKAKSKKAFPYQAQRRHQYWSVDVRYIEKHELGEKPFYIISILENFSRAILASAVSPTQDEKAWLAVLYEAIRVHGIPEVLVSDSGSIFLANRSKQIYASLGIKKEQIQRRQAWQNLIETQWNVQRRMADYHFERAANWEAVLEVHQNWWLDFNYQEHWAHKQQAQHRRSPAAVLGWVRGKLCEPSALEWIFYGSTYSRKLDCAGYVRFRNWKVYGELGLARSLGQVRLLGEKLAVEFNLEGLAEYSFEYAGDQKNLTKLACEKLYDTAYRSPQLSLWTAQQIKWYKVMQCVTNPRRKSNNRQIASQQLTLFEADSIAS